MLPIPFYKPSLDDAEINEVIDTLKSGWLTTGPKTKQFERDFAAYMRHKHAIALNSCTAALHLALEAIGLQPGDGVVVPTMTFAATAEVVRYLGGRPILVDCRPADFNLDVADAESRIKATLAAGVQVKAIMPVHYGGQIGDVAGVQSLAHRYNLKIVEDAAHCCPAFYRETGAAEPSQPSTLNPQLSAISYQLSIPSPQPPSLDPQLSTLNPQLPSAAALNPSNPWLSVGTSADISCYSFYANKTITTGEGGMACTNNDEYAERMRIMSLHGISRDAWKRYTAEGSWYYEIIAPGYKYNLTDIAAAIGIHQLRKADLFLQKRTELAVLYAELLKDVAEIILPQVQPDRIHSWHLYAIRLRLDHLKIDRAQFITELQQRGIGASVHWMPLHMHPYYRQTYNYAPNDLPSASGLYPQLLTLPLYPEMREQDIRYVCDSIKGIVAANARPICSSAQAVP